MYGACLGLPSDRKRVLSGEHSPFFSWRAPELRESAMKNSCSVLQRSTYVLNIYWLHVTWKLQSESTPRLRQAFPGSRGGQPRDVLPFPAGRNAWQDAVTYPLNHVQGEGGEQQGYHGRAARPFGLPCCLKILFLISTFLLPISFLCSQNIQPLRWWWGYSEAHSCAGKHIVPSCRPGDRGSLTWVGLGMAGPGAAPAGRQAIPATGTV